MGLGSYIICKEVNHYKNNDARRKFLFSLSEDLVCPQIETRCNNPQVIKHFSCRPAIEAFLGGPLQPTIAVVSTTKGTDVLQNKRGCQICHEYDGVDSTV